MFKQYLYANTNTVLYGHEYFCVCFFLDVPNKLIHIKEKA